MERSGEELVATLRAGDVSPGMLAQQLAKRGSRSVRRRLGIAGEVY